MDNIINNISEPDLMHLIYCSASTENMDHDQLNSILDIARNRNKKYNITGMLLYTQGSFLQVLEGNADFIGEIFSNILKDNRHTNITVIIKEPIAKRSFGEWTMGYADISPMDLDSIAGANDFFASGKSFLNISEGRAKKIISAFKEGHWRSNISDHKIEIPGAKFQKTHATISKAPYTFAFQPIIHIPSRSIFSYEALLRGPFNEPANYILNQIDKDKYHIFHEQSRINSLMMAKTLGLQKNININFPPSGLKESPTAISSILDASKELKIKPSQIVLEILESEIIRDYNHFKTNLLDYKRSGMTFALDDFGAGYAGLNLLAEFQPDFVKLDMMLIRGIDSNGPRQAIVRGIRRTCIELGIEIIAEGVETIQEYQWLLEEGIDYYQGFLLAKPSMEKLEQDFFIP